MRKRALNPIDPSEPLWWVGPAILGLVVAGLLILFVLTP